MTPKSIQRWLPLSYAAIALLAALALGAVLLTVLRSYYLQRELDYLIGNARAVDDVATRLVALGASPSVLESQLRSLAFLSQTRVRLLDAADQIVADSGNPQERYEVVMLSMVKLPSFRQTVTQTFSAENYQSVIAIQDTLSGANVHETTLITMTGSANPPIGEEALLGESGLVSYMPAVGTPFGFDLDPETTSVDYRSTQVVRQPLYDIDGELLGHLELSEGPAYGRQVLVRVAWGWGIASGAAVLLAASVGWLVSRRITRPLSLLAQVTACMAKGDLSARVYVNRQDELGALARSFNEMATRVEETVLALRRFVADAAHELHTPLTALRTNLELAPEDGFVKRARYQVERLEKLTTGLLNLSRIEAGKRGQAPAPVVLNTVVQSVAELYASQAEQAGLAFELTVPESSIVVTGDDTQLREALGNMLDNAIKFTPESGSVAVSLSREDDWATVRIRDTGIGIPAQDMPYVFGRFHRGSNAAAYPGSGLGLAIVKAIAVRHGGTIQIENVAQGTQIALRLPLR